VSSIIPPPTRRSTTGTYATPSRTIIAYTGKHIGNNKQTKTEEEEIDDEEEEIDEEEEEEEEEIDDEEKKKKKKKVNISPPACYI
jgi:amino acid permease